MAKHGSFLPLFLAVQGVLYAAFLGCDLLNLPAASTALKYGALLLCLLAALVRRARPDGPLLCCALALTAAADLFLLVLDRSYAVGVALFCPVQILYALRLRRSWHIAPPLWPLRRGRRSQLEFAHGIGLPVFSAAAVQRRGKSAHPH